MKTCTVTSNVGPPTEFQIPELGDPCEKCRAKPSTREVMIMVERPGGVVYYCDDCAAPPIAPAPQWSTTPPGEPGWYWYDPKERNLPIMPVLISEYEGVLFFRHGLVTRPVSEAIGEWWPVRIEPPR